MVTAVSDVVVIGGGIIGCAAAAFLAERGARVTLFEATALGAGASGRNLGSVQHPYDHELEPLHLETVALYRSLAADADEFVFPLRPAGVLLVATDADQLRTRLAPLAAAFPQLAPTYLPPSELHDLEPVLAPDVAAIRLETGYPVPPHAAVRAYAALARRRGAKLEVGAQAVPWVEDGHVRGVRLANGNAAAADALLLAAGPWSPAILDPTGGWRPIRRTWGVTLVVELDEPPRHILEEEEIAEAEPQAGGSFRWQVPEDPHVVFSLVTAGGRSALGSTFLSSEPDPADLAPQLLERGRHFLPALHGARMVEHRVCARPQSMDGRPFIGPVPGITGLFLCAGHGPWGISTGPGSSRLVVDAMLDPTHPIPAALSVSRVTTTAHDEGITA